ncbi:hypothetical protein E2562_031721 [Oryza meyeriana var. granulata]|uniref:Uncharacterized protein n=1 Tax=Oryza meyeriana var. granulata TaxID=110450 RepID=A0A6G1FE88_9ORYZ|nr:hypothetical protein E2562_031721 [Oryza meyeriana var. granulata]
MGKLFVGKIGDNLDDCPKSLNIRRLASKPPASTQQAKSSRKRPKDFLVEEPASKKAGKKPMESSPKQSVGGVPPCGPKVGGVLAPSQGPP